MGAETGGAPELATIDSGHQMNHPFSLPSSPSQQSANAAANNSLIVSKSDFVNTIRSNPQIVQKILKIDEKRGQH